MINWSFALSSPRYALSETTDLCAQIFMHCLILLQLEMQAKINQRDNEAGKKNCVCKAYEKVWDKKELEKRFMLSFGIYSLAVMVTLVAWLILLFIHSLQLNYVFANIIYVDAPHFTTRFFNSFQFTRLIYFTALWNCFRQSWNFSFDILKSF
jgi:hypothetical protein